MAVDLYPGQIQALKELNNGKILCGGVGSGKSIVSLVYYLVKESGGSVRINGVGEDKLLPDDAPELLIFTTAKKRDDKDWERELSRFAIHPSTHRVSIDSWNNIGKYSERKGAFIIFDEQRLVGNGSWVKAFYKLAEHNRWIMLSATPGDVWLDYVPVFVANGFYRNRTEFIRQHVVYKPFTRFPQVDRYVEQNVLQKLRRRILVDLPYERHTTRHIKYVPVSFDEPAFNKVWKDRWNIEKGQPIQDASELFAQMRKVTNSDLSRMSAVLNLLEKHKRLIIFYNFNYELDLLRTLTSYLSGDAISSDFTVAEWNGHKHQEVPKSESWVYLVQYTAGAEGWECITTDTVVFWSLNYSYKIMEQCMGRIDRFNTGYVDLYYYIMLSKSWLDKAILRSVNNKKKFNEKRYLAKIT